MDSSLAIPRYTVEEQRRGEFLISTNPARLDLDVIYEFLTNCYWAKGIPREVVARSIEHSLCFGIYDESQAKSPPLAKDAGDGTPASAQVGFARIVSDFATIAYLGDVFVLESYRGRGLSKWMMEYIVQHPALQNLRRWILLTRDAHGLYKQVGFTPVAAPELYMERHRPDVYETRKTR
jgi:GNAT superfamily N-acetyltransferase